MTSTKNTEKSAKSSNTAKYVSAKIAQNEKLINLVREHPMLYNTDVQEYKDNHLKSLVWTDIALACKLKGGDEAKRLWKNLRDGYRLLLKNIKSGRPTKMHKFYEQMNFLSPYIKVFGEGDTTGINSALICEEVFIKKEVEGEIETSIGENDETCNSMMNDEMKIRLPDDFDDDSESLPPEKVRIVQGEDSLRLFFDSMYAATAKLPPRIQRKVRKAVLDVVADAEEAAEYT